MNSTFLKHLLTASQPITLARSTDWNQITGSPRKNVTYWIKRAKGPLSGPQ